MEVMVGSTFGSEVSSPSAVANSSQEKNSSSCIFLKEDEIVGSGTLIGAQDDDSSDRSSSIGAPDDSDEDEEGEEVESVKTALNSLDSLEESLPIKRGLSNHFTGKSKSFANLSDVLMSSSSVTVKDLEKPENPFNKRRRLVLANKWCRKASFYSWSNPKSMPLLTLNEEDEQQQQTQQREEDEEEEASPSSSSSEHEMLRNQPRFSKLEERKFNKSFKSHSCFSLTDLQHQEFH